MFARRIVITGLGAVTPLGNDVQSFWGSLSQGRSGVAPLAAFGELTEDGFAPAYAAEVKDFAPEKSGVPRRKLKVMGRHSQLALAAATEAHADAQLKNTDDAKTLDRARIGATLGVGMLNPLTPDAAKIGYAFAAAREDMKRRGVWRDDEIDENELLASFGSAGVPYKFPLWLLRHIPNMPCAHLSIELDLQAPTNTITNGCTAAASALGEAARIIARGEADAMLAGGTDARVGALATLRYRELGWLATKQTREVERVSAPFDESACGFVNGEAAGVLVLEAEDAAHERGAKIRAEFLSYAAANDAHDYLKPRAEGRAVAHAIARCLKFGDTSPDEIDVVFAPASSVPAFDRACANGIKTAFHTRRGKTLTVVSTRGALGHTHAASTALDVIAATRALETGTLPPTLNFESSIAEAAQFDIVREARSGCELRNALVVSQGFGGHAAAILLRRGER